MAHLGLNAGLLLCLLGTLWHYGYPPALVAEKTWAFVLSYPNVYEPVYDFIQTPFNPCVAVCIWILDVYFLLLTYFFEKKAVRNGHKKYHIQKSYTTVIIHGTGSSLEFCLGLLAVLHPDNWQLAYATALLALLVNVPTGALLTPRVYGVKCLTIPGFSKYGYLRATEALRVLTTHHRLVGNLWILLQVGTVVRLLGYYVLPYSSEDKGGARGDLFTDPVIYSFNILLSGYLVAAFVYPPQFLVGSLIVYVVGGWLWPPRLKKAWLMAPVDDAAPNAAAARSKAE